MSVRCREETLCAVIVISFLMVSPMSVTGLSNEIPTLVQDGSSTIPCLYWMGINTTGPYIPLLDTMLDVNSDYYFTLQYNHSLGWENCEYVIRAWHDNGIIGAGSSYPVAPGDGQRNLAFEIRCDSTGASTVIFPTAPVLEITTSPAIIQMYRAHPEDPTGAQDEYRVYIPVWFGNQLRAAEYGLEPPIGPDQHPNPNIALNNPFSWDFSVTVRDKAQPSLANTSYAEFGILPNLDIMATGNPACSVPPGWANLMVPHTSIEYSANTQYWVNVSITDLLLNGIGPFSIPASYVAVQNLHPDANPLTSEIYSPICFMDQNIDRNVWGGPGVSMPPANNGLISAGPLMTDFTSPLAFTELEWSILMPVGIPEGIYWGVITLTIEGGGLSIEDSTTHVMAVTAFPKLSWIGFNETSGVSRLDQVVEAGKWCEFTLEGNYSFGWNMCEIIIEAWYDEGMLGGTSTYPLETEANENRAFKLLYHPDSGTCDLLYPPGSQVQVGTVRDVNLGWPWWGSGQEMHRVTIPVWLGPSLMAADGDGFINGGPSFSRIKYFSLNDPNSWDFSVTIRDVVNPTSFNCSYAEFGLDNTTSSFDIDMHTGWNLVSFPLDLLDTSVPGILSSISGKWDTTKYYNSTDWADPWKSCRPGGTANDLSYVDHRMGLWVHVLENCTLTVYGHMPNSTAIQLKAGWNLVGYPSGTADTVANALAGTGYDIVEGYQATSPYIRQMNGAELMEPGKGYWVHVAADSVWTIEY